VHIGFFSDNFYPELSGIADTILRTGKELASRGHRITFFAPTHPKENYALVGRAYEEPDFGKNIRVVRFGSLGYPTGTGQGRLVIPTGLRWLGMKQDPPDVMHVHLPFGMGLEGLAAAHALRAPLVGTNHTPISEFLRYSPIHAEWLFRAIVTYDTWFYSRCDFVSSPCADIFTEMASHGFQKPHRVVPNAVDIARFTPSHSKKTLKQKHGFSEFTVLYVGRLAKEKSIDVILRAVAQAKKEVPALSVVLTGRGSAEVELRALAKELGIADAVRFLGFVEEKLLPEIYAASEVFVIASTSETQSIAAAQAMATGIPIVGVRAWGLKDYITPSLGFLVAPGDTPAIAAHLVQLAQNPKLRATLGKGGVSFAKTLSPEAIADMWEEIYRTAIRTYHTHREASRSL